MKCEALCACENVYKLHDGREKQCRLHIIHNNRQGEEKNREIEGLKLWSAKTLFAGDSIEGSGG